MNLSANAKIIISMSALLSYSFIAHLLKRGCRIKTASFYVDRRSFIVCRMGLKISTHRDER